MTWLHCVVGRDVVHRRHRRRSWPHIFIEDTCANGALQVQKVLARTATAVLLALFVWWAGQHAQLRPVPPIVHSAVVTGLMRAEDGGHHG